ncbi:MAG: rhodanese-like domain-containing protein [Pyrinomonadaceae bacterium]
MSECSVLELRDRISLGSAVLVDVRDSVEYAGARIPGSKLIPLGDIESRCSELDRGSEIFVICRTGRRSAEAQRKLSALGFANVVNASGGIEAWKKEGLPIERDENAPWSIERQVRFTAGLLVLTGVLLSIFVHPYFIALSGFVGFGLAFTATIDWCGMGLLIAKMPWNRKAI